MLITIANHKSDFELNTLSEAAEFFIRSMIPNDVCKDLDIYIEICDALKLDETDESDKTLEGYAACESEADELPRHFYMALKRGDEANMLITLAHECVHIKQHAIEQMKKFIHNGIMYCRYNGYDYPVNSLYDDMPWEKEAYIMEMVLISAWGNRK